MASNSPRVLLTNDDGPPGPHSPYIFGLYRHLVKDLGWDVKVVVPSSQKSWIGNAYQITDIIHGRYYYPTESDGKGEISEQSRPLRQGEIGEWILLDGTPATCANIALHNIYPGQIDLLISGPNLGRNTSAAFSLSSGTIGAALSSSLSKIRAVALSYGTMHRPVQSAWHDPAHVQAVRIVQHLYNDWGKDPLGLRQGEVDLYTINLPMIEELVDDTDLPICWTNIWRNNYGQLFKAHQQASSASLKDHGASPAGPDSPKGDPSQEATSGTVETAPHEIGDLVFKWGPDMTHLKDPHSSLPEGSDEWAIRKGYISVTPLRAGFAQVEEEGQVEDVRLWKVKL